MEEDDGNVRKQFTYWLKDDLLVQLFYLFFTQNEVPLEELCKSSLFALKKNTKTKAQFLNWAKQYFKNRQQLNKEREEEVDEVARLKSMLVQSLSTLSIEDDKRQNFAAEVQNSLNQIFLNIEREKHNRNMKAVSKNTVAKFTQIFNRVMEICQIQQNKDWIKSILIDGSLQSLKMVYAREQHIEERTKFQKALKFIAMTNSFKDIQKYGGRDLKSLRNKTQNDLQECLLNLKLPIKLIEEIRLQLLENPLSNCMTYKKELSETTKFDYYDSSFYKSKILLEYAQLLSYPKTIHSLFIGEVSNILRIIHQKGKIDNKILKMVFQLNFEGILSQRSISNLKNEAFNEIKAECPNFHKGSQLLKYKKSSVADLRINDDYSKRIAMRDKFIEAGLRYSEWQKVEDALFARNDSIIHDLELNIKQKAILRNFFNEEMQPYFHKIKDNKLFSYEQEIKQLLIDEFMQLKLQKSKDMDEIHSFIDMVMKLQVVEESRIQNRDLTQNQKLELINALKKNKRYLEYQKCGGVDKEQIQYQAKQKLKKCIYKLNLQNEIEVSYQSIEELLEDFIDNNLKVPQETKKYVCDLKQLRRIYKQEGEDQNLVEMHQKQLKQLKQEKARLIEKFWNFLVKVCTGQQSYILGQQKTQFQNKSITYAQYLLQTNPFLNPKASLSKLGITKTAHARNLSNQAIGLLNKHKQIQEFISNFKNLNKQIREMEGQDQIQMISQSPSKMLKEESSSVDKSIYLVKSPNSEKSVNSPSPRKPQSKQEQIKKINSQLDGIVNEFLTSYNQLEEQDETAFVKNLLSLHKAKPQPLIKTILEANPFEKSSTELFAKLKAENNLKAAPSKNIEREFKQVIADKFGKRLASKYNQLLQQLRNIQKS